MLVSGKFRLRLGWESIVFRAARINRVFSNRSV